MLWSNLPVNVLCAYFDGVTCILYYGILVIDLLQLANVRIACYTKNEEKDKRKKNQKEGG